MNTDTERYQLIARTIAARGRSYRYMIGATVVPAVRWGRLHLKCSGFVDVREKRGEFTPLEGLLR